MRVLNGERPFIDSSIPDAYRDLIQNCWSQKASERPTLDEIVRNLKSNPGFITDLVDEGEHNNCIYSIGDYETSCDSERSILSYERLSRSFDSTAESRWNNCLKHCNGK